MTLGELFTAKELIKKLSDTKFKSFKTIRSVVNLVKQSDEELKFFSTQINGLINVYSEKGADGKPITLQNGNIKLSDESAATSFNKEYTDLLSVDVSDKIHKIEISESDFASVNDMPTPAEMLILDPIIDWK